MESLRRAKRLLALAQTGLHYATSPFDKERYEEIEVIAHAQLAELASMDIGRVTELFAQESGYANPKLDVRCAVFNDAGGILLVKETADGRWSLPGGWADVGLSPAENAAKEVREESGYCVDIVRLLAVWDMAKHAHPPSMFHIWKLVFLGQVTGKESVLGQETSAAEFFDVDHLPALSLGRVLPQQLARLRHLREHRQADFD
ncbi:NUDIX hydrolase [Caballeronia sp. ATUFL_M2_KS44]|uniref:NUDIX hydrolase n=1 Tax=Caballeronia sp. ATUFL_M2_KS44 TaxID=2921767 RepID=UPI002027A55B|nr:NUDIX hydrolase [Caballeronia sp. ATUFL_M2_KS44]